MPTTNDLIHEAQHAGYQVAETRQLRANRWLLILNDASGATILVLVQARRLITAADVQDLAELLRLRRGARGLLWAYEGTLSPAAQRTLAELSSSASLRFCNALPPAVHPDNDEAVNANPALRAIS